MTHPMPAILTALMLAACGGPPAGEGSVLFEGPVPHSGATAWARLTQRADGTLQADTRLRGDSRTPADVQRGFTQSIAGEAAGRNCSNGVERQGAVVQPTQRALRGTEVELTQTTLWRCLPDPRTPAQIHDAMNPVLEPQFHRCGIGPYDFVNGRPPPC